MALRIGVQWFTEWVDFSLEGVMDWGQVGTEAIMETEAGQPCRVGSLGALRQSSPWNPQSFEDRWTQGMITHPLAHVYLSIPPPWKDLRAKGTEGQESPWHSGSGVLASLPISLYLSSHSRCRCLCQDLLALPPTPSLSVSEGRAKKGSCHLSLAQGKGLLRQ